MPLTGEYQPSRDDRTRKQLLSGVERVVIFRLFEIRCSWNAARRGARAPAKFVHNDYTLKSAPRRVQDLLAEDANSLLRHRFAEINMWRAIHAPVESSPLALCDVRSLDAEDIVAIDLVYRDRVGEIYGFLYIYNPRHRWLLPLFAGRITKTAGNATRA